MAAKHKNLYLYLTLACFVGIIAIFVFDGYIGVYDTLTMDNGRFQQTFEYEQWARDAKYGSYLGTSIEEGGQVEFTYTIENHRFSTYTGGVAVSLWANKAKTADIFSTEVSVPAFSKGEVVWTVRAADILPTNYTAGQSYYVTIKIERDGTERDVNLTVNTFVTSPGTKVIPVPAP